MTVVNGELKMNLSSDAISFDGPVALCTCAGTQSGKERFREFGVVEAEDDQCVRCGLYVHWVPAQRIIEDNDFDVEDMYDIGVLK